MDLDPGSLTAKLRERVGSCLVRNSAESIKLASTNRLPRILLQFPVNLWFFARISARYVHLFMRTQDDS